MQKHRKWPKTEGASTQKSLEFHRLGAFYMVFCGYFLLEWFGQRTCFVKYIYCSNKSLTGAYQEKNKGHAPAHAIKPNMMGTMMRTSLRHYCDNDSGQRGAQGIRVSPCCAFNPKRLYAISRLRRTERGLTFGAGRNQFPHLSAARTPHLRFQIFWRYSNRKCSALPHSRSSPLGEGSRGETFFSSSTYTFPLSLRLY